MENQLQIFKNQEFRELCTVMKDGEPWFVAADVCKAIAKYIRDQEKQDLIEDKLTTKEYQDPFKG